MRCHEQAGHMVVRLVKIHRHGSVILIRPVKRSVSHMSNGLASVLWFSMYRSVAASRSLIEANVPRLRHWRVMMPKRISTVFSQEQLVGVKCILTRGLAASQLFTF